VTFDRAAGHEQQGLRPLLIVSPADVNVATNLRVVLPITSGGDFARGIAFAVPISGIKTTGVTRRDQPRVLICKPATAGRWIHCRRRSWMTCSRSSPRSSRKRFFLETVEYHVTLGGFMAASGDPRGDVRGFAAPASSKRKALRIGPARSAVKRSIIRSASRRMVVAR
jgi:mRNA interferase ChpB